MPKHAPSFPKLQLSGIALATLLPMLAHSFAGDSAGLIQASNASAGARPNIIWVLADDQGYGDFGFMGNKVIKTPHLDRMASASAWMPRFYVTPVCSTTRASLLTGRYHQRTGVVKNGSPMFADEITVAERLRGLGYATGLFGKWHLGRHYPLRPMEQGFDEVLSFRGGILREFENEPVSIRYTNPVLDHNGTIARKEGFSTDIFFDSALAWMQTQVAAKQPFFAYIAPAAPHDPFDDIPADTLGLYSKEDTQRVGALNIKIYALISKIDQNMGKLFAGLEDLGIAEDTLVIYLSDNGPSHRNKRRFMPKMRGHKGDILEGGIRTPLLAHWAGTLEPRKIEHALGSVMDLVPTVLDICAEESAQGAFDGLSLLELWKGEEQAQRTLFFQASAKGNIESNYAVISGKWKMALPNGFFNKDREGYCLFNLEDDPEERVNQRTAEPEVFSALNKAYYAWTRSWLQEGEGGRWQVLDEERGKKRVRTVQRPLAPIEIGNGVEEPVLLTKELGSKFDEAAWLVKLETPGSFRFQFRFAARLQGAHAELILEPLDNTSAPASARLALKAGAQLCDFGPLQLEPGSWRLRAQLEEEKQLVEGELGVWLVQVERTP